MDIMNNSNNTIEKRNILKLFWVLMGLILCVSLAPIDVYASEDNNVNAQFNYYGITKDSDDDKESEKKESKDKDSDKDSDEDKEESEESDKENSDEEDSDKKSKKKKNRSSDENDGPSNFFEAVPLVVWISMGGIVVLGILVIIIYIAVKSASIRKANAMNGISEQGQQVIRKTVMLDTVPDNGQYAQYSQIKKPVKKEDSYNGGVKKVVKQDNNVGPAAKQYNSSSNIAADAQQYNSSSNVAAAAQLYNAAPAQNIVNNGPKTEEAADYAAKTDNGFILLSLTDNSNGTLYRVELVEKLLIGRSNADIVIDDKKISRTHCEFEKKSDGVWLRDMNSRNGTKYNGIVVNADVRIGNTGILEIGEHSFSVKLG